ncbi:uncharacterized protein LOC144373648 isoform X4 [Ictidomys tridecemlineatus]
MESEGKTILPRIPGGLHFPHTFLLSTAGKKDGPNLGIQARGESAAHQCSLKPESNRSPETADKECCVECSSALEIHRYSRTQCPWFADPFCHDWQCLAHLADWQCKIGCMGFRMNFPSLIGTP